MISKSEKHNENYLAKIIQIKHLRPADGLDNLVKTTIDSRDILTSKETLEGQVSVYFPCGSQLAHEYLSASNSYKVETGLNADTESKGGFFESKGRVKPIKFKGNISDGYIAPISSLEPLVGPKYIELEKHIGEEFDTLGDLILVKKYAVKEPQVQIPGEKKSRDRALKKYESKLIERQFKFHYDTAHLDKNLHRIKPEDIISITWKLHGTSFISSKVLCKRQLTRWERFAKRWFGLPIRETEYSNVFSSRRVVLNEYLNPNPNLYYSYNIYADVNNRFKDDLIDGETIYGEVVGYFPDGGAVQKGYDYGADANTFKVFVYRITYTLPSGVTIDLPYNAMSERCEQIGATPVPLVYHGRAKDLVRVTPISIGDKLDSELTLNTWRMVFFEHLKGNYAKDQNSQFCKNKVPEEGVVVRNEGLNPFALKLVSFAFKQRESKAQDEGIIDIESEQEVQSE